MSRAELERKALDISMSDMSVRYEYSDEEIKRMITSADDETLRNYIEES